MFRLPRLSRDRVWSVLLVAAIAVAWIFRAQWWPAVRAWTSPGASVAEPAGGHSDHDDHAEPSDSLVISEQARRNLGLKTGEVALGEYQRSITIPAIVVERPGRTNVNASKTPFMA